MINLQHYPLMNILGCGYARNIQSSKEMVKSALEDINTSITPQA